MNQNKFKYVTPEYISNCLIESVRAKLKDPYNVKIYFCKPILKPNHLQMFHFMWSDGAADFDFSDRADEKVPWYKCFLFKGQIRQFPHGFAARYSAARNGKAGACF